MKKLFIFAAMTIMVTLAVPVMAFHFSDLETDNDVSSGRDVKATRNVSGTTGKFVNTTTSGTQTVSGKSTLSGGAAIGTSTGPMNTTFLNHSGIVITSKSGHKRRLFINATGTEVGTLSIGAY